MTKPAPATRAKRRVTEARIALVVRGAQRAGLPVGGVEVTDEGAVRVLTAQAQSKRSDVDNWFDDKG